MFQRREGYITCAEVDALLPWAESVASEATVFEAKASDLERLDGAVSPARREVFRRRMEAGQVLLLAEMEGKVVGYCGLAFAPTYANETDCVVWVGENEAYGHGAFTLEPYRGRGVYRAMLAESMRALKRRGIVRAYGAVAVNNPAARAAVRSMGVQTMAAAGSVRVLGFKRRWQRPLREDERL